MVGNRTLACKYMSIPSITEASDYINNLDFQMIIKKMITEGNWSSQDAVTCAKLYKNFLFLKKKYGDKYKIPPNKEIDIFWHHHILDTENYIIDCEKIFGEYLHHYPYAGIDGITSKSQLTDYYRVAQELHKKEFGYYIFKIRLGLIELLCSLPKLFSKKI